MTLPTTWSGFLTAKACPTCREEQQGRRSRLVHRHLKRRRRYRLYDRFRPGLPGIVDYVNADRETISFKNNPQGWLSGLGHSYSNKLSDLSNKTYFVTRNGVPAKLADIKEGDSIIVFSGQNDYAEGGFAGVDYSLSPLTRSLNVKGTLTSVKPTPTER
jgi:hypothetical protein